MARQRDFWTHIHLGAQRRAEERKRAEDLIIQRWARGPEPWCKVLFGFWTAMKEVAEREGFRVKVWAVALERTAPWTSGHIFKLESGPDMLLYVKVSTESPPFWGLQYRQIELVRDARLRWVVVLLDGCYDQGYLLPADTYSEKEAEFSARQSADGCVVDVATLPSAARFNDLEQFLGSLSAARRAEW
jgi:hypothetical protein